MCISILLNMFIYLLSQVAEDNLNRFNKLDVQFVYRQEMAKTVSYHALYVTRLRVCDILYKLSKLKKNYSDQMDKIGINPLRKPLQVPGLNCGLKGGLSCQL